MFTFVKSSTLRSITWEEFCPSCNQVSIIADRYCMYCGANV